MGEGLGKVPSLKLRNLSMLSIKLHVMDPRGAVNSRSAEPTQPRGGHVEGDPHLQVKKLGETKMELQDEKGAELS